MSVIERAKARERQNRMIELADEFGWGDDIPLNGVLLRQLLPDDVTLAKMRRWVYPEYADEVYKLTTEFYRLLLMREVMKGIKGFKR